MFAGDYRDDYAEESEDLYEEEPYRSDFESMLSANNSIDDQIRVSCNKDFTHEQADIQGYEEDFYNEIQQGSSVAKSVNIQEFSSVTFYPQISPVHEAPEGNKPTKKKVKRKQTPKETKAKSAKNEGDGSQKPSTGERRATPRSHTPKTDNPVNNNSVSENINSNNNSSEVDNRYHKYKRYEVHTPQMTDINTRTVIPITSHVVKDLRHNSFSIQRQLDLALKKIESYKNENSILRSKLDSSTIEEAVERYKAELLKKEIKISQLQEENNSLKMVARHQSKGLMKSDHDKQHQPEREMSQDRQIEILMEHIKKLKIKLGDYKCMEQQYTEETGSLKAQNGKLTRRVAKLKRQISDLTSHRRSHNSPPKRDLLEMINEDLSQAGSSSLVESTFKLQQQESSGRGGQSGGNETVNTYPSIALTDDSRPVPQRASPTHGSGGAAPRTVQEDQRQREKEQREGVSDGQPQDPASEEVITLREDKDDVSIPLDEDEFSEMTDRRHRAVVGGAVNNVSSLTAGVVGGEYSRGYDHSRVDSESTFSIDTNTNPKKMRRRREYNQRINELRLQVEEEKLYVLRQKELILKLEKSATKQRHGFVVELNNLKTELAKCEEDRKQVSSELSKRELKLKMQTLTLKQLRVAYDELLEGHKQLLATKDTLEKAGMTNPIPTLKSLLIKAHPPAEAIIEPRPPTVTRPSSTGNLRPTARAAKIVDESEEIEVELELSQGGNLTFMTSEIEN